MLLEVFPLQHRPRTDIQDRGDEGFDEIVVGGAAQPSLAVADVQRVGQQVLVVRSDVERHRQRVGREDARSAGVKGQLPDRDAHPPSTLVAQAEDSLVVRGDDQANVVDRCAGPGRIGPAVPQKVGDAVDIGRGDPQAAWSPHDVAEGLAGAPDRRRVHDRHELLEVLEEHAVEEGFVAVLKRGQSDVALEVVALATDVLQLEADLLFDRGDAGREQAAQAEDVTLAVVETRVLVQQGSLEELGAAERNVQGAGRTEVLDRPRKLSHDANIRGAYVRCNSRSALDEGPAQRSRRRTPSRGSAGRTPAPPGANRAALGRLRLGSPRRCAGFYSGQAQGPDSPGRSTRTWSDIFAPLESTNWVSAFDA